MIALWLTAISPDPVPLRHEVGHDPPAEPGLPGAGRALHHQVAPVEVAGEAQLLLDLQGLRAGRRPGRRARGAATGRGSPRGRGSGPSHRAPTRPAGRARPPEPPSRWGGRGSGPRAAARRARPSPRLIVTRRRDGVERGHRDALSRRGIVGALPGPELVLLGAGSAARRAGSSSPAPAAPRWAQGRRSPRRPRSAPRRPSPDAGTSATTGAAPRGGGTRAARPPASGAIRAPGRPPAPRAAPSGRPAGPRPPASEAPTSEGTHQSMPAGRRSTSQSRNASVARQSSSL